jgi:signal recognition particle receptor subunit alpha
MIWPSTDTAPKRKAKGKEQRKWGDSSVTESDMAALDFGMDGPTALPDAPVDIQALIDETSLGTRTNEGMYEVKDWEFTRAAAADDAISRALQGHAPEKEASGILGGLFARFTGGKVLTEQDLAPVLEAMKQRLMAKNVAKEIADKVCEGVGEGLVGKKIGNFQSWLFLLYFLAFC